MDLNPYFDDLERFADGEMSAAEQEAFELRLETDEALAEAHAHYEQLTADLRWAAGHDALQMRLSVVDERLNERGAAVERMQRQVRRRQRRWALWTGLALAVAVLAVAGVWWFGRPAARPATTWEAFYQPDPGPAITPALRHGRPLLSEALQQYQAGHYPAALHSLNRISPAKVSPDSLLYYRGLILLRQGQGVAAQAYLRRLAEGGVGELARRARYHLGMAYWQAEEPALALRTLQAVAADAQNPYQQAAQRVVAAGALKGVN